MTTTKKYSFDELSEVRCGNSACQKPLKKNVVERKPGHKLLICWECWVINTRNMTLAAYKKYRSIRAKVRKAGGDPRGVRVEA